MDAQWKAWSETIERRLAKVERRTDLKSGSLMKSTTAVLAEALRIFRGQVTPSLTLQDGRTLVIETATSRQEVELDFLKDFGVWRASETYSKGSLVSYGGSGWIAQHDVPASIKPGEGKTAWRLAIKRGSHDQ